MKGPIINKVLIKSANIFLNAKGEEVIRLVFPFSPIYLDEVRTIEGRKWNKDGKYWLVPLTYDNCVILKEFKYTFQKELRDWANTEYKKSKKEFKPVVIEGLNGTPEKWQNEGVALMEYFSGRALLADEMGLGKTIQGIMFLQLHKEARPVIIVCPAHLKLNWAWEIRKWIPNSNPTVIEGKYKPGVELSNIIIINYDILTNEKEQAVNAKGELMFLRNEKPKMIDIPYTGWVDHLRALHPKIILIDEIHSIKNSGTLKTEATTRLCQGVPMVIGISGTPIEGSPNDIFNSLKIINPNIFPNKWKFQHRYCAPKNNGFGWNFSGSSNEAELHEILINKVMIRRKKIDVWKDAPEKRFSIVPMQLDNEKEYKSAENNFIAYLEGKVLIQVKKLFKQLIEEENEGRVFEVNDHKLDKLKEEQANKANPLTQMNELKILAAKGKMKQVLDWIETFLESGEKLVVFCNHLFIIDAITKKFGKISVSINGGTSKKKRDENVRQFQENPKIRLFVGNSAAETGLTLTAASSVANVEFPWNPAKLAQRIDRVHRIGQMETVNVYNLFAINTIEEKIAKILDSKQAVMDAILDGEKGESINLMEEIIKSYTQ